MKLGLFSIVVLVGFLSFSRATVVTYNDLNETLIFEDFEAEFGTEIGANGLVGIVVAAEPADACTPIKTRPYPLNSENITLNAFVLIKRGECDFALKVLNAQKANFQAAIVSNINSDELLHMGTYYPSLQNQITIPSVFVGATSGKIINQSFLYNNNWHPYVQINRGEAPFSFKLYLVPFLAVVGCSFLILLCFVVVRAVRERRRRNRSRLSRQRLKQLPTKQFHKGDEEYETCAICLDDYEEGDTLRLLPCNHAYHCKCVDPWLTTNKRVCPLCKRRVLSGDDNSDSDEDDYDDDDADESDEEAPLLGRRRNPTSSNSTQPTTNVYGTTASPPPSTPSTSYGGTNPATTSYLAEGIYNNSLRSFQPTAAPPTTTSSQQQAYDVTQVLARSAPLPTTTACDDHVTTQRATNHDEESCTATVMVPTNTNQQDGDEYVNEQLLSSSLLVASLQHNSDDNTDPCSRVETCDGKEAEENLAGNSNRETNLVIDMECEKNATCSTSDEVAPVDDVVVGGQDSSQNEANSNKVFENEEELVSVQAEK